MIRSKLPIYRAAGLLACASLAFSAAGCTLCCSPWDDAYSAYGGSWERHDMFHGRVGSAFSPAGGPVTYADGETIAQPDSEGAFDDAESEYEETYDEESGGAMNEEEAYDETGADTET